MTSTNAMRRDLLKLYMAGLLAAGLGACQARTPAEKVENAAEDAAHETRQGVERAGERVNDAVK